MCLSPDAKKEWKRLVPELKAVGVLTVLDGDALAAYCQTFARWRAAEAYLARHGEVYPLRDERGRIRCMQQFPHVSIARSLLQVLRAYQKEFGLTPSARSRIEVPFGEGERPLAKFLQRKQEILEQLRNRKA